MGENTAKKDEPSENTAKVLLSCLEGVVNKKLFPINPSIFRTTGPASEAQTSGSS